MQYLKGEFIISTPMLDGTFFERSVLFITEHDHNGASGFVINQLFPRKLNELVEFKHAAAIDIYTGGPVANEQLFFLHSSPGNIPGGINITANIYQAGDFKKAIALLSNGQISSTKMKIFIGYCGWNSNELEAEIEEGSWKLIHAPVEIIFKTVNYNLWNEWNKG